MKTAKPNILATNRIFARIAIATAILLTIPFIAAQISTEVSWNVADFALMAVLLFGISTLFVLIARKTSKKAHRILVGVLLAALLTYIWAELAVGVFTNLGS